MFSDFNWVILIKVSLLLSSTVSINPHLFHGVNRLWVQPFRNIVPYIRKFGKHPVTGAPLKGEDLIPLIFHKNSEGEYHCPVLNKVFTEFTHIVAVETVFCYEAIKELERAFNLRTIHEKSDTVNE